MRIKAHFKTLFLTLVLVIRFGCVRTFFDSTFPQELKSEVRLHKNYAEMRIKAYFKTLFLILVLVI